MIDDYFSDEAIKARVNKRMRWVKRIVIHVALMFFTIFAVVVLGAAGVITDPLIAAAIVVGMIFSVIVNGMFSGLSMIRESMTEQEIKAAQALMEKEKYDQMTISDDGELSPLDDQPFYDDERQEESRSL